MATTSPGLIDAKKDGDAWRVVGLDLIKTVPEDRLRQAIHRLARIAGATKVEAPGLTPVRLRKAISGKIEVVTSSLRTPFPTWGRVGWGEASEDCRQPRRGFPLPPSPSLGEGTAALASLRRVLNHAAKRRDPGFSLVRDACN